MVVGIFVVSGGVHSALSAPTWSLRVASKSGDPIVQGQSFLFLDRTETLAITAFDLDQPTGPDFIRFTRIPGNDPPFNFDLSTRLLNKPIAVGTYLDARRATGSDTAVPGFDFSFDYRGANRLIAEFRVFELAYHFVGDVGGTPNYAVDKISFTFVQFADGSSDPSFGAFALNTSLPLEISEPPTIAVFASALLGFVSLQSRIRRQVRRSRFAQYAIRTYLSSRI